MTDAELVILSLVREGPCHGYEIQQAIEARGMREWTAIGFSSVYYILNKLEAEGLLESRLTRSERGPARKVYEITKAGRGVLQTAVADLLSTPRDHGAGFALGLANMHILRPEQVRTALDGYADNIRARLAEFRQRRARQLAEHPATPLNVLAIFDHTIRLWEAELGWLEGFRAAWEAGGQEAGAMQPLSAGPPAPPTPADPNPTSPPARTETLPRPDEAGQTPKGTTLQRVRAGRATLEALLARFSEAQRVESHPPDGWSVQDVLAHIAFWENYVLQRLQEAARGEAPQLYGELAEDELNRINQRALEAGRARPLDEVQDAFQRVFRDLWAALQALPEEPGDEWLALWPDPDLPWQIIASNTFDHYEEHMADLRAWAETLSQ